MEVYLDMRIKFNEIAKKIIKEHEDKLVRDPYMVQRELRMMLELLYKQEIISYSDDMEIIYHLNKENVLIDILNCF